MNTEFASILDQEGRLVDWAEKVTYKLDLNAEDKEINAATDAWLKDVVGRTGHDSNHEISQLIIKAITPEVVAAPSIVLERGFRQAANIGEFDDARFEKAPKNTIKVYDSIPGGNVDRSFVDFSVLTPTWKSLQAETDVSLQEIRRGGYRSVANLVSYIREAFEYKKISVLLNAIDALCVSGTDQYITESTSQPTDASVKKLALYLLDVSDGETPLAFAQNKYIQTMAGLTSATTYLTDNEKSLFNRTGLLKQVAGMELTGFSGQKQLPDGSAIVPNQKVFGIAGVCGDICTRGETNVLQETDINSEKIHIKVNGYTFGYAFTDSTKVAKIVMGS